MDTPFVLPFVFSPSVALFPREKCFFSPTQRNRKHLPWCEMCPYRIHAEEERGGEERRNCTRSEQGNAHTV